MERRFAVHRLAEDGHPRRIDKVDKPESGRANSR